MPANSLLDMFSPRDLGGNATDLGAMLGQRSNSLIGLGLGLMGGTAADRYGGAMRGYAQGASSDQDRYQNTQRLAEQRAARAQAQSNFERTFAAGQQSPFSKVAADLGLKPGTPEYVEAAKQYHQPKTDPAWEVIQVPDPNDPDNKIPMWANKRTQETRPLQPGAMGMPAAPANAFPDASGAGGGTPPVYGYGGDFTAPPAAAAAPAPRGITLPNGEVVTPPPGLSKKGREAWTNDVAKTAADMQTGKMTEGQAKYSIYATGMEIAQQELKALEGQGTSQWGKGMAAVPWGVGNWFQSKEYQAFRTAKDAWLNAKLRAESGATINPDEFARDERIFFPQPGDGPRQIADKARLREHITQKMTKAGGPGYAPPPPIATPATPAAPTSKGIPPPPSGFTIVAP